MPAKRKNAGFPWVTRVQAAQLVGLGPKQFDDALRSRLKAGDRTGAGAKLRYNAVSVVAALVAYRIEQEIVESGGDPDLIGAGDSPTKEELLKVKLGQERIKLSTMQRSVVPLADMRAGLAELFAGLRRASEAILNRWGQEPADVLNREIDTTVQRWSEMAAAEQGGAAGGGDDEDGTGEPGPAELGGELNQAAEAPQPD